MIFFRVYKNKVRKSKKGKDKKGTKNLTGETEPRTSRL